MNLLKSTFQPLIGYRLYSWQNVERMSGSKMWKNQIAEYSDIQKCGKKMMWRFVWIPAATFLDTHVFSLFFLFLLLIVVYAARSLIDES